VQARKKEAETMGDLKCHDCKKDILSGGEESFQVSDRVTETPDGEPVAMLRFVCRECRDKRQARGSSSAPPR